ncbi:ribonuclease HI family protein [Aestuariimicrobium sp. T2.26MG-19.2B]|uniref:ribonuclease HI family protein n=1 Tax=Aestuariimicrobium sp. T2.26MG-19.2B TaxID=3040679 RepID=UPI0024778CB4|nr:ribonuclease HI family protein [Aestuariimicrobium sp. T2.26MG-19.2B]CAI9407255.1 Ribonuclease H [Aestuariimicrobium sp. T2.26MG-19.2B]
MITAAADGSSLSNPGPAGWAWYIDDERWAAGGWDHGTNNMGELMAVVDLLQQTAGTDESLLVLCDSQYVINCATTWISGWKRRGWRKADGKPVLNVELLKELDQALAGRSVGFEWVKGHAGHELNEAADLRARAAATAHRDGTPVDHGPGFAAEPVPGARSKSFRPTVIEPEPDLFSIPDPTREPIDEPESADPAASGTTSALGVELIALERRLLDPSVRTDPDALAHLLHPEFVEHGASGRVVTRNRALAGLASVGLTPRIDLLGVTEYAPGLVGLRWTLGLGHRTSLRFSLWQRTSSGWQVRFHQGTPVGPSE